MPGARTRARYPPASPGSEQGSSVSARDQDHGDSTASRLSPTLHEPLSSARRPRREPRPAPAPTSPMDPHRPHRSPRCRGRCRRRPGVDAVSAVRRAASRGREPGVRGCEPPRHEGRARDVRVAGPGQCRYPVVARHQPDDPFRRRPGVLVGRLERCRPERDGLERQLGELEREPGDLDRRKLPVQQQSADGYSDARDAADAPHAYAHQRAPAPPEAEPLAHDVVGPACRAIRPLISTCGAGGA